MKMKWTEEEVVFLNFAYTSSEFEMSEICEALGRSESSIRNKAKDLNLVVISKQKEQLKTKVCSKFGDVEVKELDCALHTVISTRELAYNANSVGWVIHI